MFSTARAKLLACLWALAGTIACAEGIEQGDNEARIPAAKELRIDGLDPSRYAQPWQVGLILALDNPNPILSWSLPPPSYQSRGYLVNRTRVVFQDALGKVLWIHSTPHQEEKELGAYLRYDGPPLTAACFEMGLHPGERTQPPSTPRHAKDQRTNEAADKQGATHAGGGGDQADLEKNWLPSSWIGDAEMNILRSEFDVPLSLLANARRARLYASGLGIAQYYINGRKISFNESLGVGWTRYDKRCYYVTYGVLPALKAGRNAIGVTLGQGWRNIDEFPPRFPPQDPGEIDLSKSLDVIAPLLPDAIRSKEGLKANTGYTARALRLILKLQTSDGEWHTLAFSNQNSWFGTQGPVVFDSLFDGEVYDARLWERLVGFSTPNYDASENGGDGAAASAAAASTTSGRGTEELWNPVSDISFESWTRKTRLVAQPIPPIRNQDIAIPGIKLEVVEIDGEGKARIIIDFGRNVAGVVRLVPPQGRRGDNITIRHAEALMHPPYGEFGLNGSYLYTANLRTARATDVYIFSGEEESAGAGEFWQPRNTYHGFRYVEIRGWPCAPRRPPPRSAAGATRQQSLPLCNGLAVEIQQVHFRTDVERVGHVRTSSAVINGIWRMAAESLSSNLMSIPTDCPQRDERLGWLGDAGLSAQISAMIYDMRAFHDGYLDLIEDDMSSDGSIPDVVPYYRYGGIPADPSWSAAFVSILFSQFRVAANLFPYWKHRESIMKYLENIARAARERGGLASMKASQIPFGSYGDWVPVNKTHSPSITFVSAFSWLRSLQEAEEMALAAGDEAFAAVYHKNYTVLRSEILEVYYDYNRTEFENGGQTSSALGLRLEILDPSEQKKLGDALAAKVGEGDWRWDVGIFGFRHILQSLLMTGHGDTAFRLLTQTEYPSLGWMMQNPIEPASSNLWELWNSPLDPSPDMNSRNHHMYASIGLFIYEVAGLIGGQDRGLRNPIHLAVGGCCGSLASSCLASRTAFGALHFCWSVADFQSAAAAGYSSMTARPDSAGTKAASSKRFNVTLPSGSHSNVFCPVTAALPVHLRITTTAMEVALGWETRENGGRTRKIFDGVLTEDTLELGHSKIPGLQRLAYDRKSRSLVFTLGSGEYSFNVTEKARQR